MNSDLRPRRIVEEYARCPRSAFDCDEVRLPRRIDIHCTLVGVALPERLEMTSRETGLDVQPLVPPGLEPLAAGTLSLCRT